MIRRRITRKLIRMDANVSHSFGFIRGFVVLVFLLIASARGDDGTTILARVLANRPLQDFSLKARLFATRDKIVPVDLFVKHAPNETRTIYRADKTELLVIQPVHGPPRFFLKRAGELTGARRMDKFLGSQFSVYDLGLGFLQWPDPKLIGEQRLRGRDCYLVEVSSETEPYKHVKLWIDKEYAALLRAEAFDENGDLVKRFAITSFKRLGNFWIPRGIEIASVPPGQSLPAEEKSRLEILEGNYETKLPTEMFKAALYNEGKP
jgi:hypothetical protein